MISIYGKCIILISFKQQTKLSYDKKLWLYLHKIALNAILLIDMLNIGSKITQLRKTKNWSQEDLAKKVGSSRVMIGNYERNTNTPSIDILLKIAKTFEVTVDYLIGEGQLSTYDKEVLKRINDIEHLPEEDKQHIFYLIDNLVKAAKLKTL